jgi:8-oxo-dGTP pyrophosphatase MutT (NUDIX family)
MPNLDLIRSTLTSYEPKLAERTEEPLLEAAVAVILYEPRGASPELLLIERAVTERDPWSGQMAFPGGRRDPGDPDLERTAARETLEEVGVRVGPPIGRLDDVVGSNALRPQRLVVSPFVYQVSERPRVVLNHEVSSTVWVPATALRDPAAATIYRYERSDYRGSFPAVEYRGYTIWGLTYRVLSRFFDLLERPLPHPG